MKLNCVVIDDEPLAIDLIIQYISKFEILNIDKSFLNALAGKEYLEKTKTDLLFLDIQMPDISGIQLLQELSNPPIVILTTAYSQYAIDGFELDVIDYLLKPIEFERFEKAINKAINYHQYLHSIDKLIDEYLYVRSDYQLVKIEIDKIEYIESMDDYIKIFLSDKSFVMTLMSLKKIIEKLPDNKFIRVHRSYAVANSKIKRIVNRKIQLSYIDIPIGDTYVAALQQVMK